MGLPEGANGARPEAFLTTLLINTFGRESFFVIFVVERAHWILPKPPPPGAPPRIYIANDTFLNGDQDTLFCLLEDKGLIPYENVHVHVYPDFSLEGQRKRPQFNSVNTKLREKGLKYAMIYPARLYVQMDDQSHFFDSPEEAHTWL